MPKFRMKTENKTYEFTADRPEEILNIYKSNFWGHVCAKKMGHELNQKYGNRYHIHTDQALINDMIKFGHLEVLSWYDDSETQCEWGDMWIENGEIFHD